MAAVLAGYRKVKLVSGDKFYFVRLHVFGHLWVSRKIWRRASPAQVYGVRLVERINRWVRKGYICPAKPGWEDRDREGGEDG